MSFQQLVRTQPQSTTSSFPNLWVQELENQHEDRRTCRNSELEKKEAFLNLLWEIELANQLANKSSWVDQLQKNLLENDEQKQLDDNKKLQEKNFQSLIYEKLVALLPKKHFALAASTQLLGNEAWEKSREASEEISFDKVRGKEHPPELRRDQLVKELWSPSLRAICPSSFEDNSLHKATFKEESFAANTFLEKSFAKPSFTENSFTKSSFTDSSFTESSLTRSSFTRSSLTRSSLTRSSLTRSSLTRSSLTESSLTRSSLTTSSLPESSLTETSFSENTFFKTSFPEQLGGLKLPPSSFGSSSLKEASFAQESFQSTALQKSFAQKSFNHSSLEESRFTKSSFQKSSLAESSLEASSFNQRSFEESSFTQSSLEESSLKTGSFEQSSFETNSFELSDFGATSLSKSSFHDNSLADKSFAQLRRPTFTPELAQLKPTASHTELGQLEEPALEKGAYSLELRTAYFAPREALATPLWPRILDNPGPRGSAKAPASRCQLDSG